MRFLIMGALTGLIIGTVGALGYSHYFGEGRRLAELQAELSAVSASSGHVAEHGKELSSETDAMSSQIDQLAATNDKLKQQVADLKKNGPAPGGFVIPTAMLAPMADRFKTRMEQQHQQKMLLLKTRLHLTPDQEAALQAEMDGETKKMQEMSASVMQSGKFDPGAFAGMNRGQQGIDQTLDSILTPDQKTAYQQMQADQKKAQTETAATAEMNEVAPLLQLNDTQKDQVYSALYQARVDGQDPATKQAALAKILTPDQMSAYQQQSQYQSAGRGNRWQGFGQGPPP
jgi:cell division protein FtsB